MGLKNDSIRFTPRFRWTRKRTVHALTAVLGLVSLNGYLGAAYGAPSSSQVTTLLYNAHVFTGETAAPYAEAVAIRDGKILAVGSLDFVAGIAGAGPYKVDLAGQFLMPGMIDANAYPIGTRVVLGGGYMLMMASFPGREGSLPDLIDFVGETLDAGTSRLGDTLVIYNINVSFWVYASQLDEALSNGRFADIPVVLMGADGHTAWANRKARTRAGITAAYIRTLTPPMAAYYGVGPGQMPNGFVAEAGLTYLRLSLQSLSPEQEILFGEAAVHHMNALGITGWVDAAVTGVMGGDLPASAEHPGALTVYREIAKRNELTAHVAAYPIIRPVDGIQQIDVVESLRRSFSDIPNLIVPGFTVYADGIIEYPAQNAALTRPYRNTGRSAPLLFDPRRFNDLVVEADRRGLIVHIDAVGNLAVKASLDAIDAARQANPSSTLPHMLTHGQFIDAADLPRIAEGHLIAAPQWAIAGRSSDDNVKPYIDPAIYGRRYPARSLLDTGVTTAGSSEWPVNNANPFLAIYQAETRVGPGGVLDASERMPREAMLMAYTRNAARALNQLDDIGTIAAGKRADLVLVDRDILVVPVFELNDAKVVWTMFGGRIVYGPSDALAGS